MNVLPALQARLGFSGQGRLTSWLLSVAAVFALAAATPAPAGLSTEIRYSADGDALTPGSTFDVLVRVANNTEDIGSFSFQFGFDPAEVQPTSPAMVMEVPGSPFIFDLSDAAQPTTGVLNASALITTPGNTAAEGDLFKVGFEVVSGSPLTSSDGTGLPDSLTLGPNFLVTDPLLSFGSGTPISTTFIREGDPDTPFIGVDPLTIDRTITAGTNAADALFNVENTGGGTLNFSITSDQPWVSTTPTMGMSSGESVPVTVFFATAGLAEGGYSATLTVSDPAAANDPVEVAVDLKVNPALGGAIVRYTVDADALTSGSMFNLRAEITDNTQDVGGLAFQIGYDPAELMPVAPVEAVEFPTTPSLSYDVLTTTETMPGVINIAGLVSDPTGTVAEGGLFTIAFKTISGPLSSSDDTGIPDSLTLGDNPMVGDPLIEFGSGDPIPHGFVRGAFEPQPEIGLTTTNLAFSADESTNPPSQQFGVFNAGGGLLDYTVTVDAPWLMVSPEMGSSTGETDDVTVAVDTTGLAPGMYAGTITVSDPAASNDPRIINVTLAVNALPMVAQVRYSVTSDALTSGAEFDMSVRVTSNTLDIGGFAFTAMWDPMDLELVEPPVFENIPGSPIQFDTLSSPVLDMGSVNVAGLVVDAANTAPEGGMFTLRFRTLSPLMSSDTTGIPDSLMLGDNTEVSDPLIEFESGDPIPHIFIREGNQVSPGFIRVLHLAPLAGPVDIYIDGALSAVQGLAFESGTGFIPLPPGNYTFDVVPAGGMIGDSVLTIPATIGEGEQFTAVAYGEVDGGALPGILLAEDFTVDPGNAKVRAVHTALNVGEVDVLALGDPNTSLFPDLGFGTSTALTQVPAATYRLGLDVNNDLVPEFAFSPPELADGLVANVFAVRDAADAVFLLLQLEDSTLIRVDPDPGFIRVLHLAPLAGPVDIYINGVLSAVQGLLFENGTDFIPLSPGDYTFDVVPAGGVLADSVLTVPAAILSDQQFTAVAYGEVDGGSLPGLLLEEDFAVASGNAKVRAAHTAINVGEVDVLALGMPNAVLFPDLPFGGTTALTEIAAGLYRLGLDLDNDLVQELSFSPPELADGLVANVFAVRDASDAIFLLLQLEDSTLIRVDPDPAFELVVGVDPADGGVVDADPAPNALGVYNDGTTVTLTATPNLGFEFVEFIGDGATTLTTTTVVMDQDRATTAVFEALPTFELVLNVSPPDGGTVVADPLPQVGGEYIEGTVVTLTATPNAGFLFASYTGDATGTNPVVQVTLDSDRTVTANFDEIPTFPLDVVINPPGAGTVDLNPLPDGEGEYLEGTVVTLTASPAMGFEFLSYTGDATGTDPVTQVTMDSAKTVTANFQVPAKITFDFPEDTEGWIYTNDVPPFASVIGSYDAGAEALTITTNENTNSFAFWESPTFVIGQPVEIEAAEEDVRFIRGLMGPESIYRTTWSLSSDLADPALAPTLRVRSSAFDFQQSDVLVSTSVNDADFSPGTTPREYVQIFSQPEGQDMFRLDFDMLNFLTTNAATATFSLDMVMVEALGTADLGTGTPVVSFDFLFDGANGFTPVTVDALAAPEVFFDAEGLTIQGVANKGEPQTPDVIFGFYSLITDVPFAADTLYRVRWQVGTSASGQVIDQLPTFRLRVNDTSLVFSAYTLVDSVDDDARLPSNEGGPQLYDLYIQTPAEIVGDNWIFSFDYLYVAARGDDPTLPVTLEALEITEFDVPAEAK